MSIQKALDSFGKIKVLHIDDDELFLDTIKLSIESINNNIKIDSQTDSSNIKNKIIEYDCVLLDYLMPGKDGLQIAAKIREFSEVPIILYTVQVMENISELIKSNYINAFIKKELNDIHYVILESQIINLANKYRYNKIYNKILDNVNDFIAIIDIDLNLCFYNNSFKNYLNGINFIGKSIIEIFESSYKTSIHDFLEKKENEKIDDVVINYNNDNRYVEIHKSKLSNESDYLFLVIKDTTVHSVQKEITYSSDVRFNALSKLSTDAILWLCHLY